MLLLLIYMVQEIQWEEEDGRGIHGSSSWYYKCGIENILGFVIKDGYIIFDPCIPDDWKEYFIKYKWKKSFYNITVKNPNNKNKGVSKVILNEVEVENRIKLYDDGIYNIEVIL